MTDVKEPECTCQNLLNGHHPGCPWANWDKARKRETVRKMLDGESPVYGYMSDGTKFLDH